MRVHRIKIEHDADTAAVHSLGQHGIKAEHQADIHIDLRGFTPVQTATVRDDIERLLEDFIKGHYS